MTDETKETLQVEAESTDEFEAAVEAMEKTAPKNGLIRVVDNNGHLLFCYNPATNNIEIKMPVGRSSDKNKKFAISVDALRSAGARNFFTENPQWEFKAEVM